MPVQFTRSKSVENTAIFKKPTRCSLQSSSYPDYIFSFIDSRTRRRILQKSLFSEQASVESFQNNGVKKSQENDDAFCLHVKHKRGKNCFLTLQLTVGDILHFHNRPGNCLYQIMAVDSSPNGRTAVILVHEVR